MLGNNQKSLMSFWPAQIQAFTSLGFSGPHIVSRIEIYFTLRGGGFAFHMVNYSVGKDQQIIILMLFIAHKSKKTINISIYIYFFKIKKDKNCSENYFWFIKKKTQLSSFCGLAGNICQRKGLFFYNFSIAATLSFPKVKTGQKRT